MYLGYTEEFCVVGEGFDNWSNSIVHSIETQHFVNEGIGQTLLALVDVVAREMKVRLTNLQREECVRNLYALDPLFTDLHGHVRRNVTHFAANKAD